MSKPSSLVGPHAPDWSKSTSQTTGDVSSLDSYRESPTSPSDRDSGGLSEDQDSTESEQQSETEETGMAWNRQQSRTFHRVMTMLYYWEQNDYLIRWITLTSSPDSPDSENLAYNHQRLRQCVERADLAYDERQDDYVPMSHIDQLEHVTIRTSEGPENKGVIHTFWAWKPHDGQHSRDFYIPQNWLSGQWDRLHNASYVWIEDYGSKDYHDRGHVARYCASQYVGDHGEALESVSWSWGRSLGGALARTWEAVKAHTEGLQNALKLWHRVLGGETVRMGRRTGTTVFKPPPNLGTERTVSITPPADYNPPGPDGETTVTSHGSGPDDHEQLTSCNGCGQWKPESSVRTLRPRDGRIIHICSDCS